MTDIKMFTDPNYEPARELDPKRLKQVQDARIKIADGAHGEEWGMDDGDKMLCIMEATYYILYGDKGAITDSPPCTSSVIREFMIGINDSGISDRKRAMLKAVIPDIVNTAPIVYKPSRHRTNPYQTLQTDPAYKDAESKRKFMLADWTDKIEGNSLDSWETCISEGKVTMKSVIEFIRELAAVAKFDKQNADASAPKPINEERTQ